MSEELICFIPLAILLAVSMHISWRLGYAQGEHDTLASLRKDPNAKP